jgi:hypothetical protein
LTGKSPTYLPILQVKGSQIIEFTHRALKLCNSWDEVVCESGPRINANDSIYAFVVPVYNITKFKF